MWQNCAGQGGGNCLPAGGQVDGAPSLRPAGHSGTDSKADCGGRGRGGGWIGGHGRGPLHAPGLPALQGGRGGHGAGVQEEIPPAARVQHQALLRQPRHGPGSDLRQSGHCGAHRYHVFGSSVFSDTIGTVQDVILTENRRNYRINVKVLNSFKYLY